MSLATPRRIFARQPRRLRAMSRLGTVLVVMLASAGGGALLAASFERNAAPVRQAWVQR